MTDLLQALGLTQEEMQNRVITQLCDQFTHSLRFDEDGEEWEGESQFALKLRELVKQRIGDAIADQFAQHVAPNVEQMVYGMVLQRTTEWGEKRGEPVTFTEYMVQRAEAYMRETVDSSGRSAEDCRRSGSSFYTSNTPRLTHMIDKYLHLEIEKAMKEAFKDINSEVAKALTQTARLKLGEIVQSLKVTVQTKS